MLACTVPDGESTRPKITLNWRGKAAPVVDLVDYVEVVLRPNPADVARLEATRCEVELVVSPWTPPAPLDECLACWKAWMHGDADRDLGAKPMGGLVGDTDGHGVDVHEQQQARDTRIAVATDAMIESMQRIHVWAIYRMCSLDTPWRFPNADLMIIGDEARQALTVKLKKNVCTSVLF
ncbi:MAG: hypothetical protein V4684_19385 [Pseudomonadota bacterium]